MSDRDGRAGRRAPEGRAPGWRLVARGRHRRLGILSLAFAATAVLLGGRLAYVQVLKGASYAAYQQGEVEQQVSLPAARGPIYDRNGDLLAVSVPRYLVVADDFLISSPFAAARALAPLLNEPASTLAPLLHERNGYVVLAREVTAATKARIAALGLPGIAFLDDTLRVSPGGSLFQPLLGGVNYAGHGDASLEYEYDHLLSGTPGSEIVAEAPGGLALPAGAREVVAPKQGTGLVLTIDEPLQLEVTRDLGAEMKLAHARSGIAIVESVHTGAILAMVDLVAGPKGVIGPAPSNIALTAVYQPGSVMKIATFSWALRDGLITPSTRFTVADSVNIGGYTFQDAEIHPTEQMPASQILAQSSNVGTIEVAHELGMQRLYRALHALGFGQFTGLNWPGESPGLLGTPASWIGSFQGSVPIGTGEAVTPMQVLDAYNAVANGGVLLPPHLVGATVTSGTREHPIAPVTGRRILPPAVDSTLISMFEGVVRQDGTSVLAHIPGYTVAGKTGTAQVPDPHGLGYVPGDWNASFVGFVPAQAPELSGIVVLNHPTPIYGGSVSAPVFSEIMRYALRRFDIAPPTRPAAALVRPNGTAASAPKR